MTAYYRTMQNASDTAVNMAVSANGAAVEISQIPKVSKAAELGLKALSIAGNMLVFMAISKGIELAVTAIDNYIHKTEKMKESLEESVSEFETATSEVKSLEDELKTCTERLEELQKLADNGTISIADEKELELLKETNEELERKIALKQAEQIDEQKDVLKDAKKLSDTKVESKYALSKTTGRRKDVYADNELLYAINDYNIGAKWAKENPEMFESGNYGINEKSLENTSERIQEMYGIISPTIEAYDKLVEAGYKLVGEEKIRYEQLKQAQDAYLLYNYNLNGTKEAFQGLNVEQQKNILLNRLLSQGLSNEQAKFTLSSISEEDYDDLWNKDFSFTPPDMTDYATAEEYGKAYAEAWLNGLQDTTSSSNNSSTSFIDTLNSADNAEIKDELLELAKSGEITPETLSSTEEYAELLSKTETSAESATNQILDMLSAQEKLSGLSQGLDKLKTAYEEFKDEDIGFVTAETLSSLPDAFKNLPEFDLFSEIVGDPTSGATAIQQAFNDIVKAYMLSQDTLQGLVGASEHDIQSYIANIRQMGVTNSEEVVNLAVKALNTENELINGAQAELEVAYERHLEDKSYDYERYLKHQSSQNTALVNALGETYKADYDNWCDLLHDKAEAYNQFIKALEESGIVYDSSKSVQENAQNAIKKEGYSPSEIDRINRAASNAELSSYLADKQKQALQLDLSQITTDFGTKYSPSTGSDGSSDSNKPSEVTQEFNWIEKYLESFARRTEKIMNKISDYLSFKKNLSTIKSAIKSVRSELSANEQALAEYAKQMNAIGLSQTYIDKIKNGELNIETITGYETDGNKDANAQLIEKIEKYQDLYDKYTDIEDTIEDLRETEKEWLVKNLEYVNEYYQKLSDIKNLAIDKKQDNIDLKEAQGKKVTTSDYNKLVSNNEAYIKSLRTTYKKTNAEFNKLVNNGTIEKNSAEWFEWKETLADLNSEIVQAKINTAEWKGEINQIKIDGYTNSLDRLKAKHDKLNDAISKKKSSGVVVSQSDYNKVINNLNQQLTKNEKLLALYKNLQSGTEKGSAKWLEYQELIEGTETEIASLGNSIIEAQEAINQLKIDKITSSLDRLEAKNEKLNDTISRKELSGIVANQSDYDNVINNLNQQITKNEELLEYYKELQSQTKKNSEKWREYQELIEGTESTVASLKNSIIETAVKMAGIIAEIKNLKLEDNENAESLLDAKYDNATSASERNKILDEKDALAKSNYEINKQAAEDYEADVNKLGTELISYADKNISDAKSAMEYTSNELDKEKADYDNYAVDYESAKERYLTAKTKSEKSDAKAEMEFLSQLMSESDKRIKALEGTLSSYGSDLKESQNILSQLESYEFGKEIDLSQITDKDLLEKASQYNETLKQQKQALIDVGLSEQEAIKILRENASKRIQNLIDEAEALDVLNQAMKSQIKSKMDLNKTQGYNISDVEYENYIGEVSDGINLLNDAYNKALAEFNNNLKSGVYEDNEELYLKDKANIEKLKASIYDAYAENESMLDEILQSRIDALNEEKEAIQKLYDLQERRYKLEEAQYNLEKAKQRTNLVYNGEEFVYQSDSNALKDAEKALEEAQHSELINKIDDWIQAMEDAKEDFNLYDADGNPLGSTEDIIKAVKEFGDNFLDGFEKLLANNGYAYSNGEITKVQAFAEGGVVGKSDDDKFKAIAKSLGEDNLVAVKDGEMVLTKLQSNELYKKLVGTGTVPTPILDLKPVIPDNLVRVNTTPNIEVNLTGDMQFNEVQNVSDLSKAIVNGQLRGAIKQGLGRLKV